MPFSVDAIQCSERACAYPADIFPSDLLQYAQVWSMAPNTLAFAWPCCSCGARRCVSACGCTLYDPPQYLQVLDMSQNRLTGALPSFLGTNPSLRVVRLAGNLFEGSLSAIFVGNQSISTAPTLETLDVRDNRLTSNIGIPVSVPASLQLLLLDGNYLGNRTIG